MPTEEPDLELIRAAQAGDTKAFDGLMEKYRQRIFRFIWQHLGVEADAMDLAQETFVRAYFGLGNFRPEGSFSTWLHQIALNLCRDHVRSKAWRNRQRTDSISEENEAPSAKVEDGGTAIEQKENLERLNRALDQLPLELKGPLVLTAVEGMSQAEAGKLLGLTVKAVETRIYRARKKLLQLLR